MSLSPEAQILAQSLAGPWSYNHDFPSSLWGYSSPVLDSPQQVNTSPSLTGSTASTLLPGSPNHMQHYTIPAEAIDVQDSTPAPASLSHVPDEKQKKIPRPPNAFILFRSWLISNGRLPQKVGKNQQEVSKIAGKAWKLLDQSSKDEWRKKAFQRLKTKDPEKKCPDYQFNPLSKNPRAKRPRRKGNSPCKFPVPESTPQESSQNPQPFPAAQTGSPSTPPLTFMDSDSPSSSSVQSLSQLSPYAQFAQGMPQQPLPRMFIPPGLPNHFEQAYQQEDGTIVFSDNYAPVNPFYPPPGHYTGMPPTANTSQKRAALPMNVTATMLGLYELSSPSAYYSPNLLLSPFSADPLPVPTFKNLQPPFAPGDRGPSSFLQYTPLPDEQVSFARP